MRSLIGSELPAAKNQTKIKRNSPAVNLMYVLTGCLIRLINRYGVINKTRTASSNKSSFSVMIKRFRLIHRKRQFGCCVRFSKLMNGRHISANVEALAMWRYSVFLLPDAAAD